MKSLMNRKRLLYETTEDIYFYMYNILLILNTFECISEEKNFQDYRKLSFLIDIISNDENYKLFIKYYGKKQEAKSRNLRKLQYLYYDGIEKIKFLRYVLLIMEKNKLIAINNNDNKTNVYIIRENNEAEFFINIRFEEVINKIKNLPRSNSIKKIAYKTFIKNIFKENGVKVWEE